MERFENTFLSKLQGFKSDFKYVSDKEEQLISIKGKLVSKLEKESKLNINNLNENNCLFELSKNLNESLSEAISNWDDKLEDSLPMKKLSEQFSDRIILLVFGKVNAGKSSFCNYIISLFEQDDVKRFHFNEGIVEYFSEKFSEGVTETTAQIQGVELGENLVLLDSPGLHSVMEENGDLTRRYTDSADGILWLTSSSSPGQVQELMDLQLELEKKKPLLPVITKSDCLEEDFCEEIDDFKASVVNKTIENRALQENDVYERVYNSGGVENLEKPVSISIHAYKESSKSELEALKDSGLINLFTRISPIIEQANKAKINKSNQQVINFLDYNVLEPLRGNILPLVRELKERTKEINKELDGKMEVFSQKILSDVLVEVPSVILKYQDNGDKDEISNQLNFLIEKKLNEELEKILSSYVNNIQQISCNLTGDSLGDFEDVNIDVTKVSGNRSKSVSSTLGGGGGAALGFALGGPIGGIVGGILGGLAGSYAGDKAFIEISTYKEKVGVSSEQMIATTSEEVRKRIPILTKQIFDNVKKDLKPLLNYSDNILKAIDDCKEETVKLKEL